MPRFTQNELTEMVRLYYTHDGNARRTAAACEQVFNRRVHHQAILRTVRRFARTGRVDVRRPPGRPSAVRSFNFDLDVLLYQRENPHSSERQTARVVGCGKTTVHRVLHTYGMRPFRSHVVHGQREGDKERRLLFLAHMEALREQVPHLATALLWTDESTFTNNGLFNRWNFRTWADENPRLSYSTRHQVRFTVNVWCGLVGNHLIGPHFLTGGSLNGERYLQFLQEVLPELLEDVPLATRQAMWFQHDGCPAHNARAVTRHLDARFRSRWIGNRSLISWPARSPDLTPLDYFLWGYLKNKVYDASLPPIASAAELQQRIIDACESVSPASTFEAVTTEWDRRAAACLEDDGGPFERLL